MELRRMQIIVFTLGDKYYALNTEIVEEITETIDSTNIPNTPDWIEGLINLRGSVVTLVNLFKLLDRDGDLWYNNIIIIRQDEDHMGLMVSDVVKVTNISEEDLQESTNIDNGITGIILLDDRIVNLIDIKKLLSNK